jgi:hypothetical protein
MGEISVQPPEIDRVQFTRASFRRRSYEAYDGWFLGRSHVTKIELWRDRAEELRTIAAGMNEPTAKRDLTDLASKWERMAAKAESDAPETSKAS